MPAICPHLGLPSDPQTVQEFPAAGNTCHRASPPGRVRPGYQSETCLTSNHLRCPVYQAVTPGPLPEEIAAPQNFWAREAARWLVGAVLALALLALGVFGLPPVLASLGLAGGVEPDEYRPVGMTATLPVFGQPPQVNDDGLLFDFTAEPNPTHPFCPRPEGYVEYVVKPTDSLIRLSQLYRVSLAELQMANCLGSSLIIRPGDRLHVPYVPTPTASVTLTATRRPAIFVPPTSTVASNNDAPPPAPTITLAPTKAPPTAAPPTPIPPTPMPPTPTLAPPTPTLAPTDIVTPSDTPASNEPILPGPGSWLATLLPGFFTPIP